MKKINFIAILIGALLGSIISTLIYTLHKDTEKEVITSEIIIAEVYVPIANDEIQEPKVEIEEWVSLGEFKLTAYCACIKCCGKSDGITASGTQATAWRTIAVDPKLIPYGTEVKINDHIYIAEDCGGKIKNNRIDIFFDDHKEALNFGVQYSEVFIKE